MTGERDMKSWNDELVKHIRNGDIDNATRCAKQVAAQMDDLPTGTHGHIAIIAFIKAAEFVITTPRIQPNDR